MLLDGGAEIDHVDSDCFTPLLWAGQQGHEAVVRLLLDRGAGVNAFSSTKDTLLSLAAQYGQGGHKAVVQLLLDGGATVMS
jgi:ankyrin repeat protein